LPWHERAATRGPTSNTISVLAAWASLGYRARMSFETLRAFVTVAEEENLTRAATRLRVCQPPLTRRIRGLEDELGTPLFERHASGMRLLPAGERLLGHARVILDAVARARDDVITAASPSARRSR